MTENEQKKDAPAVEEQVAPLTEIGSFMNTSDAPIIAQADPSVKQFKRGKPTKVLGAFAKVNTLAIKCYAEQLPYGEQYLIDQIKATKKSLAQLIAIKHYRDGVTDGIWAVATVKPHWHIIVRFVDGKIRMRVMQIMKQLGIVFRQGVDDELWLNHGVETVGNFAGYALYLTHETEDAIREGKELYEMTELVSNLSMTEMEQIREGYVRVSENRKLNLDELVALDKEAYDLGYNMGNFSKWYNAQTFMVRANAKMKVVRESYERGVEQRVSEGRTIQRLCIFIEGEGNTGKTYAATHALEGKEVLCIEGGGSGKFDKLRPDHDAIVVDDDVVPNLLNMTDNYICHAYRRHSGNPAWAGEYFIVTSNLSFEEWCEACGVHMRDSWGDETRHCEAMKSRFFICRLKADAAGVNHLALTSPSRRGSAQEQTARADKFVEFKKEFDRIIAQYQPSNRTVDFSAIIESD